MINLTNSNATKTAYKRQFLITAEQEATAQQENTAQLGNFTIAVRTFAKRRKKLCKNFCTLTLAYSNGLTEP